MCLWLLVNNHFSIFTFEWAWCVQPLALSDQEIIEMILFPMVNESCRVLAERIVVQASDLDISTVLGMGFPPYRCISKFICRIVFFYLIKLLYSDRNACIK